MSTFIHSLQLVHNRGLELVQRDTAPKAASAKEFRVPADDGLGCMRGLAVAMLCNIFLVLIIAGGWGLWFLLH